MTISSETRRAGPYSGNGNTVNFPFAFKVFTTAQVLVTRTVSGVETVLTLTTDYTVTLNADQDANPGGTVTMLSAPAVGTSITITSNLANLQPTALANLGGFYPEVINDSLDRATIQIQQLDERLDRALVIPVSSSGIDTELPVPESGKLIGWDSAGTALQNYANIISGSSVVATGSTTARTLADRFAECTNVKDFGAVGDGVANDTAALQAAISAANLTTHKTLYFPAGTYRINGQLIFHSGVTWFGDGLDKSTIQVDASAGNIIPFRTNMTASPVTAVTSITSASTTATVTTSAAHGYTTGDLIRIIGASPSEYTGEYTITVTGVTTFTYTFAGSVTSPATGTITCAEVLWEQTGVALYDLHFKGFDQVLTTTPGQIHSPLMRMWKIDGLIIQRCKLSGHRYIMLSLGGVKNFVITDNEFEDWGRTDDLAGSGTLPANEGGAAIWCSANSTDNTPSTLGTFQRNWFHDAEWACIYLLGQYLDFSFNRMENTKEGNYARSTDLGANSESRNITYVGNIHKGVTKRFIQAAGFECGAKGVVINDNIFQNCVAMGLDLTDTCEDATVTGNFFLDCATSSDFSNYGSLTLRVTAVTADALNGVIVAHNTIRSSAGNYGIRLYRVSGSETFNNIRIVDNDLVDAAASSADNLDFVLGQLGTNVVIEGNNGADDYLPASLTWVPVIDASTGTITTVSATTARYNRVGNMVFFTIVILVTTNGTGAGTLRFTLPTTPVYGGAAVGRNANNGIAVSASWGITNVVAVNYATGAYPIGGDGQSLRISGFYLEA